ncbi:MAG TPA: ATP-binding protein [Dictyobacter sp.]|jgi:signal transduction histidine kinase|nr:ATP-binding protein [Dictyobacter sp.]
MPHFLSVPALILQTIALALSVFNLIAFLWLACTVWLNGDRRSMITHVGVVGLGLSALFFFTQAILISSPLSSGGGSGIVSENFLWRLIWFPALGVPYIWFVIGLYYASLINVQWRKRRPILLILSAVMGCVVMGLLIQNRSIFTFRETLILFASSNIHLDIHSAIFTPIVSVPILFLCYVTFCAIGPWFTPSRVWRLFVAILNIGRWRQRPVSLRQSLADAYWNDQVQAEQLEEPNFSWHLARPILLLAALVMVCLTISLGLIGGWSIFHLLHLLDVDSFSVLPSAIDLQYIPVPLLIMDMYATGCVSFIVLLIGYSIVRHGILIERPLARRGFLEQWRGIVIFATTLALFISLLAIVTRSSLGALLLITAITTGTYALFTWSSYTVHDRYIELLGPFLRSSNVRHWLSTDLQKTEQSMEMLFSHLCKQVLEVQCARLVVLAGPVRRSFNYRWPMVNDEEFAERLRTPRAEKVYLSAQQNRHLYHSYASDEQILAYRVRMVVEETPVICWVLPIYDELGLVAELYLGPRQDGGVFTNEDMGLAQACCQRILDALRNHEAMLSVAGLLRRRIVDVKLAGVQQRRVLHDEILPMLHLALLRLETVRSSRTQEMAHLECAEAHRSNQVLNEAVVSLSDVHRQLAAMMRTMATGAPHRLERDGMMHAIHTMLEQDFQHTFDQIVWDVSEETARRIDDLVPPAIAELIFAAVQEVLRNAGRHARGTDLHRRLSLSLTASCDSYLEVIVADDGVGIVASSSATTGTGGGLLTHSALLAIAGGSLTVKTGPGEGVVVRIYLPINALQ